MQHRFFLLFTVPRPVQSNRVLPSPPLPSPCLAFLPSLIGSENNPPPFQKVETSPKPSAMPSFYSKVGPRCQRLAQCPPRICLLRPRAPLLERPLPRRHAALVRTQSWFHTLDIFLFEITFSSWASVSLRDLFVRVVPMSARRQVARGARFIKAPVRKCFMGLLQDLPDRVGDPLPPECRLLRSSLLLRHDQQRQLLIGASLELHREVRHLSSSTSAASLHPQQSGHRGENSPAS